MKGEQICNMSSVSRIDRSQKVELIVIEGAKILEDINTKGTNSFRIKYHDILDQLRTQHNRLSSKSKEGTFYEDVSHTEMSSIKLAMSKEFSGSGHWYRCTNGHLYTVGECGMPMELSTCPECHTRVGGHSHTPVEGNFSATDFERL
jgi:hypothetical protein